MPKLMEQLHKIREAHHERVKAVPLHLRQRRFPTHCEHCGERLASATQGVDCLVSDDVWTIVGISKLENGQARIRIQSPRCPMCSKRTVTELDV